MSNCKCNNYKSLKDYREENIENIGGCQFPIEDDDCIHCHYESIYGKPNPTVEERSKRAQKRYDANCSCGFYYPYEQSIKRPRQGAFSKHSGAIAPMMPMKNCFNCYTFKRYGTVNPEKVKEVKKQEAKDRLEARKHYREGK